MNVIEHDFANNVTDDQIDAQAPEFRQNRHIWVSSQRNNLKRQYSHQPADNGVNNDSG